MYKREGSYLHADADANVDVDAEMPMPSFPNGPSLHVDRLFTNIPLDESIDTSVNKLFQNPETLVNGISKNSFSDLLNLTTKESFSTFSNKFHIQEMMPYGVPL